MSARVVMDASVRVCARVCRGHDGGGWMGFEGVCGGFERCSLLQKPCAAATDRRQRVSSDSVWTDRGGYGRRRRKQPRDDRPVVFMRGTEEDKCCQLRLYISALCVSLYPADGEAEPST